jgi:uncharacterized protein YecE (DUF72 family)
MLRIGKTNVLVGTCGFAEAQDQIFRDFEILEVQSTFYQPPRVATAERWRHRAPEGFVFTLKAWQLLTHEASSPTYRRLREQLSERELARVGSFRWNEVTRWAWERTQAIAEALKAEAILLQTPVSFRPTQEHLSRLHHFFNAIDRQGRWIVFEPRGEAWKDDTIRRLVEELDLIHGVDPFLRKPTSQGPRYFRLHGRPAYHYHYRYTDDELKELQGQLSSEWPNRVLFNNDLMAEDARCFLQLIRKVFHE